MNTDNIYVAIMAGGIGSRFWPLSRVNRPKQFLDILGIGKTLIQMTYERFENICPPENIYIVTNQLYKSLVKEQLPQVDESRILLEPVRKNTAPCIAYVSHKIYANDPQGILVVSPSDHIVIQTDKFAQTVQRAIDFASSHDALVTLGIKPTRPDTGYGYIQRCEEPVDNDVYKVKIFTEKPTLDIAKSFIKSGDFLWNAGIFIFRIESMLKAFRQHLPEIDEVFYEGKDLYNTDHEPQFIARAFTMCRNISIDYGIMEKADNVYVIPSDFGWSDLGTWTALHQLSEKDYQGNVVAGKNVMLYDTSNCMIMALDEKLVVIQGLKDFCVIDTEDVLLICKKSKEQFIRQITADVKSKKGEQYL